jgi:hypothetical protein
MNECNMGYVKDKHHGVGWERGQGYVFSKTDGCANEGVVCAVLNFEDKKGSKCMTVMTVMDHKNA